MNSQNSWNISERIGKIYNISKRIYFNKLAYYFKNKGISPKNFISLRGLLNLHQNIFNGDMSRRWMVKGRRWSKTF